LLGPTSIVSGPDSALSALGILRGIQRPVARAVPPSISVIMPNFNNSKFIGPAIASVLSQTLSDFELLVIDDASTDGSNAIVQEISKKDPRVTLLRQPTHVGVSRCRNVGIRSSSGGLVGFLDSDDLYAPNALQVMHDTLARSPTPAVVYSDCWYLDGEGRRLGPLGLKSCTSSGWILGEFLLYGLATEANLLLSRGIFDDVGLYDETLTWGEDADLDLRLARKYRFIFVDQQLYGYRFHPENATSKLTIYEKRAIKTPILEKHFKANIRMLDYDTRRKVNRKLVDQYFDGRLYRRALSLAHSDPGLFLHFARVVLRRSLRKVYYRFTK